MWSIRKKTEGTGTWRGEVSWGKAEREMNNERLWTLRNNLRVFEERGIRGLSKSGGGY